MNRFRICAWIDTSNAATASSHTSTSGCTAKRPGDPNALTLAAAELMRVAPLIRRVDPGPAQLRVQILVQLARREPMHARRLPHDLAYPAAVDSGWHTGP